MRNSKQNQTSQRRGTKGRRPTGGQDRRSGGGDRKPSGSGQRSGPSGSGTGQRNGPSGPGQRTANRNRSRNEISQAWASDTSTLSSHMPTVVRNNRNGQGRKTENKSGDHPRSRSNNRSGSGKQRFDKNDRNASRNPAANRKENGSSGRPTEHTNREPASRESTGKVGGIDSFELFCAYHLGITREKGYRQANINEVANRFRTEPAMIKQALKEYDMDPESLLDREFDMALAQLDIQVAPEGVDRLELARGIYEEFQSAPRIKRDWNKILEEDRKENQKVFKD